MRMEQNSTQFPTTPSALPHSKRVSGMRGYDFEERGEAGGLEGDSDAVTRALSSIESPGFLKHLG